MVVGLVEVVAVAHFVGAASMRVLFVLGLALVVNLPTMTAKAAVAEDLSEAGPVAVRSAAMKDRSAERVPVAVHSAAMKERLAERVPVAVRSAAMKDRLAERVPVAVHSAAMMDGLAERVPVAVDSTSMATPGVGVVVEHLFAWEQRSLGGATLGALAAGALAAGALAEMVPVAADSASMTVAALTIPEVAVLAPPQVPLEVAALEVESAQGLHLSCRYLQEGRPLQSSSK